MQRVRRSFLFGVIAISSVALLRGDLALIASGDSAMAAAKVQAEALEAVKLAVKGDFIGAGDLARRSGDTAAIRLVELIYLRDKPNEAGYPRIMAFLNDAPNWPLAESLVKRAERSLYVNRELPELVLEHFRSRKPSTVQGFLAYARALIAKGDGELARSQVRNAYYSPALPPELESQILAEFGAMITIDDHKIRMWRLVYALEANRVTSLSRQLPVDYQSAAVVARDLLRLKPGADRQYAELPAGLRQEPALKFALVRFHRSNKDYASARRILTEIPGDAKRMGDAEAWWSERRIIARYSVGKSHRDEVRAAYQIARSHGLESGDKAAEAEFLAGWIALRYLDDAATAQKHFKRLGELAETRTDKARAGYWMGRALEARGRPADAKAFYRQASQYTTVYYGQLAREKVGLGMIPEVIPSGDASESARRAVSGDEAVRAFLLLAQAGRLDDLPMFLEAFPRRFKSTDTMNAVASIVWFVGGPQMAIRLAKAAAANNLDNDAWSYPVRGLPEWKKIGKPVETPLVYALARQESEFNPTAGSRVGAQGLMQIMPATAKMLAKQYKLDYREGILLSDAAYNVMLGAAHLGDLISTHGGSYVLTLVSYNAGPRRSREWIAEYGDFRAGEVDPVDWVESIPFTETRQYVQKVMQNLHIYRSRLAPLTVQPMTADLARGAVGDGLIVSSIGQAADPKAD